MPESYIQLPTDGQGKKHRTLLDTISGESVHHPVLILAKSDSTLVDPTYDPTAEYHASDRDTSGSTQYYGYLAADGRWYIMSDDGTAVRYAAGTSGYTTNWGNRATSVVYDYFDAVF